jgi:Putative phage tail protein
MATISGLKELEVPGTPLFLFDCTLKSGDVERWSTHSVTVNGNSYLARVLKHNIFEIKSSPDATTDAVAKLSITLANADSFLSSIERNIGWKGAQLTVTFLFFDLINSVVASDSRIAFRGIANSPDESTESSLRLSFTNRLNLQRVYLPEMSIQKRCPWTFPATAAQRLEAVNGGQRGEFSPFYRCGYSADQTGGVGNLNVGAPYTTCDFTRTQCQQRGMFASDAANNITRRFGGIEFVPASIIVRTYGERGSHVSNPLPNQALYNDYVPLIYGTGWYQPPVVLARNDGNLTHFEVLLGAGEIAGIVTVVVNNVEIPAGISGKNMTATGWYNVISLGTRNGNFNPDFSDSAGNPLGDPYGSMAFMSVVVPNNISNGTALPSMQVLVQGLQLATFGSNGDFVNNVFTNSPAWVLVDVLCRSGWSLDELDLASFAAAALVCNALVSTVDLNGNATFIPRYQCNLILTSRRSAGDVVRGIRNACGLYLIFSSAGLLQLNVEDTLAAQQPTQAAGSNSTETLDGGWPAYEFGDNAFSGILRNANGQVSLKVSSVDAADSPNRYTIEFQDQFNQYQQDSLSLVDVNDAQLFGQDVVVSLAALGLPNLDQAVRAAALQLYKSVDGNTYVEFDTSVKAVGLRPGDIITLTYSKEGFERQPFRITEISPSLNYRTATITAQIHNDEWYAAADAGVAGLGRQPNFDIGVPRPLIGSVLDSNGNPQFGITGSDIASSDGTVTVQLTVAFSVPDKPAVSSVGIPLVGLNPQINTTGGTITGAQTLYYAFSALDASGAESGLSFTVAAIIPAATNTNQVTLISLSLGSTATGFNVYRGTSPSQLLRIATNVAVAVQFVDSGDTATLKGPPDYNFDHANFYWRFELQPPEQVNIQSINTVGNSTLNMLAGDYDGATVWITGGAGAGQERTVASYTPTTITVATNWNTVLDSSSLFAIAESTWQFGASSNASPVVFVVPNRDGMTIEVSGRAANILNNESDFELSPLTRWTISGSAGSGDTDVPGQPTFALSATGQGAVEVQAIGFASLDNTATISAGTLTLGYWNELNGLPTLTLSAAAGASGTTLNLSTAVTAQVGDLVQIESEILVIQQAVTNATSCTVSRGTYGSSAATHVVNTLVYLLLKKTYIMPFANDFFGSLASGSYAYPVTIPDVRVATAELFVTNDRGNSSVARECFSATTDVGLRTLSGGQLTIQIEGPLAIQTDAAPVLLMDTAHSVRDVYAVVQQAPTGTAITMQVTQNGTAYCQLTIPINAVISNDVDGFALGPLAEKAQIGLDITAVTETSDTSPGSDLTVTIRL